jgi:uncharacterized peroxidase-related enzyme
MTLDCAATSRPISRFPVPDMASLPEDLSERILAVQDKAGFVSNVSLALALRPNKMRAFFPYHDVLMEQDSGLTKAEREMIVVAISNANGCQYCVVAHGAVLRIRARDPLIADQIAVNYRKADITPRRSVRRPSRCQPGSYLRSRAGPGAEHGLQAIPAAQSQLGV